MKTTAMKNNITPGRIIKDEPLLELARHPIYDFKRFKHLRNFSEQQASFYGRDLIDIMSCTDFPEVEKVELKRYKHDIDESLVDFLQLCLRLISQNENISVNLLASKSDLTDLVKNRENASTKLLQGWRYEVAGKKLIDALQGRIVAKIDMNNGKAKATLKLES